MEENRTNKRDTSIDPQVAAVLESLRPTPNRDPNAVQKGRLRFETEIDSYLKSNQQSPEPAAGLWAGINQKIMEVFRMNKFALTTIVAVLVIAVILFGGASATVSAAQSALPGDALYSVKTGYEQAQLQLTREAYNQAMLNLEFAERRLDEIASLIADGRYSDISTAVSEFEAYVQGAIDALGGLAQNDPARAGVLTQEIANALSRYAQILSGMLASVPESVADEVERAIRISQGASGSSADDEIEFRGVVESIVGDLWTVNGRAVKVTAFTEVKGLFQVGDWVKIHAFLDDDGTLTAREIELDDDPNDNFNNNNNTNANGNYNDNDNNNANFNDNSNDNSNLNSNDNDDDDDYNSNFNDNDNEDDDGNMNSNDDDGDDGNYNSNSNNDNDDDDNNSNDNDDDDDDDNSNDNDDDDDGNSNDDDDDE